MNISLTEIYLVYFLRRIRRLAITIACILAFIGGFRLIYGKMDFSEAMHWISGLVAFVMIIYDLFPSPELLEDLKERLNEQL